MTIITIYIAPASLLEVTSTELKQIDALNFGQSCASMFELHLKIYSNAAKRALGLRPLLQNMLSGKYTCHQEDRNKTAAASHLPMFGVTHLTFDMSASSNNRSSSHRNQMRGQVHGYGIALSDQLRVHYTIEGTFDWSRGDVVLVRRTGK